jgi:antitoxin CptB
MAETAEARLKRMKMRSMRRGIKEMDLILGGFADRELESLTEAELQLYDALLSENDHDLYQWVSGQKPTPAEYLDLMSRIAASQSTAVGLTKDSAV